MEKVSSGANDDGLAFSKITDVAGDLSIAELRRRYGAGFAVALHGQFRFRNVVSVLDEASMQMLTNDPPVPPAAAVLPPRDAG
jgi:hypothetical protein